MSTAALSVAAAHAAHARRPSRSGAGERSNAAPANNRIGWAFVAPFVVVFAMFLIWPLIHGFYLSFTGESITGRGRRAHRLRQLRRGAAGPDHVALAAQHPVVHGAVDRSRS